MKSSESIHIKRARRALAMLRQKVEAVLKGVPNFMSIENLSSVPRENRKDLEHQLLSVFFYGEYYVERVMSDLSAPMVSVKDKKLFDYYQSTYKSFRQKMRELIDVSDLPSRESVEKQIVLIMDRHKGRDAQVTRRSDIEHYMDSYENFLSAEGFVESGWYRHFGLSAKEFSRIDFDSIIEIFRDTWLDLAADGFDDDTVKMFEGMADGCEQMVNKPYFDPASWAENEADLFPIFVTDEMNKIPIHIQKRIEEIRRSFIFCNWMATIALSRCLLEYALIHKKSLFEKRLNRRVDVRASGMRAKPIRELVSIASEAFPELEESMSIVVEYGNNVMHPFRRIVSGKPHAKQCVEEIGKIVGALYGQPKQSPLSRR